MNTKAATCRILIVDDNQAIHDDFRKILRRQKEDFDEFEAAAFGLQLPPADLTGFDIDSAYQGLEAFDAVARAFEQKRPYAVAFVDVRMPPGWDGIETIARLWQKDPELQVVLCTAYSDYSWDAMREKLGRSDRLVILKKPFDTVEVLQLAESLTRKWQLLQESNSRLANLEAEVAARTAEIVREQARFRAIFENSPMGIFQTTPDGRILCANPALTRMIGHNSATDLIREVNDLSHQIYTSPERRAEFVRILERDQMVNDFEAEIRCKDGSRIWINLTAFNVRDSNGKLLYYEGFAFDVTARKKADQQRREMEVQLRHAQKMESIGQLAAGIAHEINTPTQYVGDNTRFLRDSFLGLRRILDSYAMLLQAAESNSVSPEHIERVKTALQTDDLEYCSTAIPTAIEESLEGVGRIAKIVGAMKDFSHPGSDEMTGVDLGKSVETTATVARNVWKHVAEMKFDFDANLPLIPCMVGEFNQAILNLIINAAHAIGDVLEAKPGSGKGTITVSTRRCGEWAEVRVSDTGAGIPESIRPRIFEPFFTTKGVGKGTGQGLAIVYSVIVKKHGGTVAFESEVNKGTSFILRLPLAQKQPVVQSEAVPVAA